MLTLLHGEIDVPQYLVPEEKREEEIARFEQGLMETRRQIQSIRAEVEEKVGEEEAAIFDAHQLVLEDRALIEDTVQEVQLSGFNIEFCFQRVANRYIEAFAQIDDDYIKERASDIRDVTSRLIHNLLGKSELSQRPNEIQGDYLIVADDLAPSEMAVIDFNRIQGIATQSGSRTSHSVIMARSLNVPCVVGIHGLVESLGFEDELLIDGFEGSVFLNPSAQTLEKYGKIRSERESITAKFLKEKNLPVRSVDGVALPVLLNVEGIESENALADSGAEGVGLFRTENLFILSESFPSEENQYQKYREVVGCMPGKPVTIRTLDIGGDKNPHRTMNGYTEANPFMGFRGIRFCLEHRDIFKEQLRAILRASAHGTVRVLYPMISTSEELQAANECLREAMGELQERNQNFDSNIQRGCMIEVPSAVAVADLLARHCDFFSVGTNDLIQYLLAVDRINDRIAHLYDPSNPAVIRTLSEIFKSGRKYSIPVSVCGELAADPSFAPLLLGMGASELSVSLGNLAGLKYLLRRLRLSDAQKLAREVLKFDSASAIQQRLAEFGNEALGVENIGGY